ncbi:MAG: NADH-quinone oxidoreductase subunit N [Candidatus Midichloriaceae bacterium]|jgi:NADH-quinone oxidoreductase subunit N
MFSLEKLKDLYTSLYFFFPEIFMVVGAFLALLLGLFLKKNQFSIVSNCVLIILVISIYQILQLNYSEGIFIFNGSLLISRFTEYSKIIIIICNIIILLNIQAREYKEKKYSFEAPILMLLITIGMCVFVSSSSLITLYLGLELFSLGTYVLIAWNKRDAKSIEASLKYFILGSISSGIFLFGASFIYGSTGSVNFLDIVANYSEVKFLDYHQYTQNLLMIIGLIMVVITMMFKLSLFPFHNWTPDVYEGSNDEIVILLASSIKYAALIVFIRLLFGPFLIIKDQLQIIIGIISISSMLFGNIAAIMQNNLKRLIAYSSIGHMGFVLMSVIMYSTEYLSFTIFYAITYIISIMTFFIIVGILGRYKTFDYKLKSLRGMIKNNPFLAFGLLVVVFSMAGIPPFAGFFAKFYIFLGIMKSQLYYLALIGFIAFVLGIFYYLNIIRYMYFEKSEHSVVKIEINFVERILLFSGVMYNLLYIFFPSQIMGIIDHYITSKIL